MAATSGSRRVVIVGGGFAGLFAARRLKAPLLVTLIDRAAKTVTARRSLGEEIEFGYDYLILAAGVRQSYFGHDEYAAFAPGMKSIEDALKIRRRVFGAFELAESATDPAERKRWLTFALVGAGPTGVELAGQIRELAT